MHDELVFARLGLGAQTIGYQDAWDLQRQVHEQRVLGQIPDTCLLLEHEPVYTAGKRTAPLDRPLGDPGAPVIDVDRGGKITWHGPGPARRLPDRRTGRADRRGRVRARLIEEALIGVCADWACRPTVSTAAAGFGCVATVSQAGPKGCRYRHSRRQGRHHARIRAQLRL